MKELMENNVKICTIGHLDMAPQETQDIINTAIEKTKDNTGLKLCFAFIYGGRDEIVHAGKNIAIKLKEGLIKEDDINEQLFSNELMTKDLPDYGSWPMLNLYLLMSYGQILMMKNYIKQFGCIKIVIDALEV